jgi:hypothetical protein
VLGEPRCHGKNSQRRHNGERRQHGEDATRRRDTFAAFESEPDWINVAHNGGQSGRRRRRRLVAQETSERHAQRSLGNIENGYN